MRQGATRVRTLCAKAWGDDGIWDGIPETAATAKTASDPGFGKQGAQRFAVAAPIPQKRSLGRSWALQILERPISVGAMSEN